MSTRGKVSLIFGVTVAIVVIKILSALVTLVNSVPVQ
jgi:hypothetical protein